MIDPNKIQESIGHLLDLEQYCRQDHKVSDARIYTKNAHGAETEEGIALVVSMARYRLVDLLEDYQRLARENMKLNLENVGLRPKVQASDTSTSLWEAVHDWQSVEGETSATMIATAIEAASRDVIAALKGIREVD